MAGNFQPEINTFFAQLLHFGRATVGKGCGSMEVSQLRPDEAVHLNMEKLDRMCTQLGYDGAELEISHAMEDLAVLLQQAGRCWRTKEYVTLKQVAEQTQNVANRIGMIGLECVAADVVDLSQSDDMNALAATVARMRRLGELSLLAIWDRADLIV